MGLLKALLGDPQAVKDYRAADDNLDRIASRDHAETGEWHDANDAMWAARERVPWWRR